MIDDVDRAWRFVHAEECGGRCRIVNDPQDTGGATAHGIARNHNPAAWKDGPRSVEQARDLFRDLYWRPAGCNRLAWPLSLATADLAFNSGLGRAKRFLARVVLHTGSTDPRALALALTEERRVFLQRLRSFERFGKGWMARCDRLDAMVREA